jgi:PqqD family protein of HPr-rel-A system
VKLASTRPQMTTCWRLVDSPRTLIIRFDDEYLVFNPLSWDTHLLNESAASVLEALRASPCSFSELAAGWSEPESDGLSTHPVATLLDELETMGLVEQVVSE